MDPQAQTQPAGDTAAPAAAPVVNVKQQIVEKVNGAKNILVTVGTTATVDELSAALGLTFLLGKLGKHATAVFSGKTPPAIDFLDPEKTFERTVDSLRDFIIALDKEKADKLRYKVEDDVVKVFITPYKTTITEKDLQFSQGDFNVDVVVAIGIAKREDLDKAITAHGRILHDAEVVTVNANGKTSDLGSTDWADETASSVSEMLVSISESFGSGLLDEQIATALLTGIVAETNRFSNEKTSPKVMTMAAQLMAAGANQQLIASNLRQEGMITETIRTKKADAPQDDNAEVVLDHKVSKQAVKKDATASKTTPEPVAKPSDTANKPADTKPIVTPKEVVEPIPAQNEPAPVPLEPKPEPTPGAPPIITSGPHTMVQEGPTAASEVPSQPRVEAEKPVFGGTLNATADQAAEDRASQDEKDRLESAPTLEHSEASQAADAVEAARQALEALQDSEPFDPANKPTEAIGAQQLPPVHDDQFAAQLPQLPGTESVSPDAGAGQMQADAVVQKIATEVEPSPVDAFMQPHADAPQAPNMPNNPLVAPVVPQQNGDLPPLPPMPPMPGGDQISVQPPLPPVPGQPMDPTAGFQPQLGPAFMQGVPQSQNSWTEAGQAVADKQADKDAIRQEKLDKLGEQYDAAADRNRELQGKQPLNNDHSTFPLPPTQ